MSAVRCDNCGSSREMVKFLCCSMPNPNDLNAVEVLDAAIDRCGFPPRFSWMTQDQLLAYQTLRNAQNYLLGNGLAVLLA